MKTNVQILLIRIFLFIEFINHLIFSLLHAFKENNDKWFDRVELSIICLIGYGILTQLQRNENNKRID